MLLSDLKKSHEEDRTGIALDEFVALSAIREIARSKKVMTSQITARGVIAAQKSETGDLLSCLRNEIEAVKEYHLATFNQAPDFEDFIHNNPVETVLADGLATLKKRGVLSRFRKDHLGLPRVKDFSALAYYATHGDRRLYSPTADQNVVVVGPGAVVVVGPGAVVVVVVALQSGSPGQPAGQVPSALKSHLQSQHLSSPGSHPVQST